MDEATCRNRCHWYQVWKTGFGVLYGEVDELLDGIGSGALGRDITRLIEAAAANIVSEAVDMVFFGWDGGNFSAIGEVLAGWYLMAGNE